MAQPHYIPDATDDVATSSQQGGSFLFVEDVSHFMWAGNAYFTLTSERTGKHYTYRLNKLKDKDMWFASVMQSYEEYAYFGFFVRNGSDLDYVHAKPGKSIIPHSAPSVKGLKYFVGNVERGVLPNDIRFQHIGKCGRCGRALTNPESIDRGIGPECAGKV